MKKFKTEMCKQFYSVTLKLTNLRLTHYRYKNASHMNMIGREAKFKILPSIKTMLVKEEDNSLNKYVLAYSKHVIHQGKYGIYSHFN